MARLAQQVPPETREYRELVERWAQQALPVLQAVRVFKGQPGLRGCLEILERQALRAQSAPKGLKE
jgi:hypothetical protein